MSMEVLLARIQAVPWFTQLGLARDLGDDVAIDDLADWRRLVSATTLVGFGLDPLDDRPLNSVWEVMNWLPTGYRSMNPIDGQRLARKASDLGLAADCKAARMAAFRVAAKSQRHLDKPPLLRVGPTDLTIAAMNGGRYACRMAANEVVLGEIGFWCRVLERYEQGYWPLGWLPGQRLLVL